MFYYVNIGMLSYRHFRLNLKWMKEERTRGSKERKVESRREDAGEGMEEKWGNTMNTDRNVTKEPIFINKQHALSSRTTSVL